MSIVHFDIIQTGYVSKCIAGHALSGFIHLIRYENLFGNPDWYLKCFGTYDHLCPAWNTGLPPSMVPPPTSREECDRGRLWCHRITYLPASVQSVKDTYEHRLLSYEFFSNCSQKRWEGCRHIHHLLLSESRNLTHLSTQE